MGQWDHLKSKSVSRGLNAGLQDDLRLSHSEVVDIIRATLSNGNVSSEELDDLSTIADVSRTLSARSQRLLRTFVATIRTTMPGWGPYRLPTEMHRLAADMACDYLQRQGRTYFPKLERDEVGVGLLMRIARPGLMNQSAASLCGPMSFLYNIASDRPIRYASYAIELYELGKSTIGRVSIEPGEGVRGFTPPRDMAQIDWLTAASLRDSENWFFDYDDDQQEMAGITMPGELALWFTRAGYTQVQNETNVSLNKDASDIDAANRLLADGYRVCLFIDAEMLNASEQKASPILANHWVVLRSPISRAAGKVTMKVFTWGQGEYQVPQGDDLALADFLNKFYGYVAAKP